ncbi:unnamed protein product [Allacma fusca]|uniref:Glucose-methanol-choline oxidoreductase N-terminal domain-containing protein n=1 Tax=Allacma fusca TaxID=39272 RepID=A0A8J2KT06_9HEXA|nr:unnamed protein product [Allacma fusca]
MQYERGSPQSYDQWAKITGDRTWKYEQILKYFKKMEEYLGISTKEGNGDMNDGTLNLTLGQEIWFNAGRELGFTIFNFSEPQRVGFHPLRFTQKNGMRINTYAAFLKTIEETRKTFLEIRRYSIVSKILFEGKRATGVYYTRHGIPRVASAMKEVIICAGTFKTPILLIKSGIGSESQLRAANVGPIIAILPEVGRNLQDHPIVQIGPISFDDNITLWNPQQNFTFEDVEQFFKFKKGPLTNPYELKFGEAIVASNGSAREVGPGWPDLQISFDSVKCTIRLIRSHSRGLLKFNSSATGIEDPFFLTAEFKFFKIDRDIDAMIQGIDFCFKVVESTESFQKFGAKHVHQSIAECDHEEFGSKEYWTCYVKHTAGLSYSAVGTCRMGKKYELDPPRSSVVDHKLRVHDVENLRIVDASVMPTIPNANVAAATMMIAEKSSDIIINHYCRKNSKLCETKNKS